MPKTTDPRLIVRSYKSVACVIKNKILSRCFVPLKLTTDGRNDLFVTAELLVWLSL